MAKNTVFFKAMALSMTALTLISMLILTFLPVSASANSAPPIPADNGSGIVFKQHEHIQIEKEVLNITVGEGLTAHIDAVYTMKNTSNQALSVETMFLSPIEYGENKHFSIKQDGVDLNFSQEFYALNFWYSAVQDIADWETVLANLAAPSRPFEDASGFFEYKISAMGEQLVYAKFTPNTYYFLQDFWSLSNQNGLVEVNSKGNDILIITRQDFTPTTNSTFLKTQIPDIYEYLFDNAVAQFDQNEYQAIFAEQQFNAYLAELDIEDKNPLSLFRLNYIESYISAITYNVDFLPNQTVTLSVSYDYQMGGSASSNTAKILYFLTPAKYWKSFADIEINVYLNDTFHVFKTSTLDFEKIEDLHFQYKANSLPMHELQITLSTGKLNPYQIFGIIAVLLLVIALILIGILITAIILHVRKRKQIVDNNKK